MAVEKKDSDLSLSPSALRADFDFGRLLDTLLPLRELRVPVRRPDDLLVFDLLVQNLDLKTGGSPRLVKRNPAAAAYLIAEFPPQSFAEEAFVEASDAAAEEEPPKEVTQAPGYPKKNIKTGLEKVPPLPASRVRMSGRSRLAFTMPAEQTALPFRLDAVLEAMRTWPPSLDVNALPDASALGLPGLVGRGSWLKEVASSAGWQAARAGLASVLSATGGREVDRALAASGRRIAERAAGGLVGSARRSLGQVMFEALHGEMEELVRRFPALRDGAAHQAALAVLSLAAVEELAPAAARTGFDAGQIGVLPYLPLLLAPHEPPRYVTALELPYRLILSPIDQARWLHRDAPVEHRGRTELWHTRLRTAAGGAGADGPARVRALWSPDYPELTMPAEPPRPFRASLDQIDRRMLVQLMAGYDQRRLGGPLSSEAKRLQISALGGLLDAEGNWSERPAGVDLQQWRHLATLGRDHYVRVVYAGFLCPFGHAASLVKVTERKFESLGSAPGHRVAVLRQRFFIVCRERIKQYPGPGHVFEGRNFPFQRVEILTRVTPNLLPPESPGAALQPAGADKIFEIASYPDTKDNKVAIIPRMAFWPMLASASDPKGVDFRFEVAATDIAGRCVTFSMPLLFVGEVANVVKGKEVRSAYNAAGAGRRGGSLGGACVCYAPVDPAAQGDPRLPTGATAFAAGALTPTTALSPRRPSFHPEIDQADAGIPALRKMLGRSSVVRVAYAQAYKDHAFGGGNPGEVFLRLVNAHGLEFGGEGKAKSDTLGALAAPEMSIVGLSRIMGPVAAATKADAPVPESALSNAVQNRFDPADVFPRDLANPLKGAKILGGVDLGSILGGAIAGLTSAAVPKLLSRELPDRIEASFEWDTEIAQPDLLKLLIPNADGDKPVTRLVMESRVTTPLADPGAATYATHAELNNFKVNLFGFIIVWFETLRFDARKGQKPDVTVELRQGIDAVQFGGPLEFVNDLRKFIPSNGFSDPPSLAVTPSGISASYSLNLPSVQVGLFALSNASLGAGFDLPFDARPAAVRFNFSERHRPFSLTVSLLGGGGFFAIGVSARGVQEIEAALEFGAALAIDLGVASGGVEIKAGIYFHWLEPAPNKGSVELAGYVRLHGELSVLGIISASLTFELKLAYLKQGGKSIVWGEAKLIVEIEILFFSMDVSVRCRREFGGGASDPKFIELVPDAAIWTEYCEAFAEEAA